MISRVLSVESKIKWLLTACMMLGLVLASGCEAKATPAVAAVENRPSTTMVTEEPPTDTPKPTDTPTPEPTDTPGPTDTPTPEPTETPEPTPTGPGIEIPEGWTYHSGINFYVALPDSWQVVDVYILGYEGIYQVLEEMDSDWARVEIGKMEAMEADPQVMPPAMWAVDLNPASIGHASMTVQSIGGLGGDMDETCLLYQSTFELNDIELLDYECGTKINDLDGGWFIHYWDDPQGTMQNLQYLYSNPRDFWISVYEGDKAIWDDYHAIYFTSAESFVEADSSNGSSLILGVEQEVLAGGFSFRPLAGFENNVDNGSLIAGEILGPTYIELHGVSNYEGDQSDMEIIDEYLQELGEIGFGKLVTGDSHPITVDDIEGIAVDLTGTVLDEPIDGQSILVRRSDQQYIYGMAFAIIQDDENRWLEDGHTKFSALLETIRFLDNDDLTDSACPVSTDDTYGTSKDNPIKVGGDWLEGPKRERAYLDSLRGSNGEKVTYQRIASLEYGDTILDEYRISYDGVSVTLYLDEYTYQELMAPVGFICLEPIPLDEPE